jgi:stage V sporulation protein SpoVS
MVAALGAVSVTDAVRAAATAGCLLATSGRSSAATPRAC